MYLHIKHGISPGLGLTAARSLITKHKPLTPPKKK